MPDQLGPQFEDAPAFYEAFGWHAAYDEEVEADDLLHSYARAEEAAGGETLILTGDRDMYQSANEHTTVLYVKTGTRGFEEVGPDEVRRRYGVPPELVPDFIALRGDPSDGIPGAKGIGEKTAADLLKRHGSLETALGAWSRERPARVAGSLRDQADELRAFKDMASLRTLEVDLPPDTDTDIEGGASAATERGMEQLAGRLGRGGGPA
jgi:DNA polymerase-1